MSLSNKREVREHIKQTLQPYEEGGHIDVEEMKALIKEISEGIVALPTTETLVTSATLTALRTLLEAHTSGAPTEVLKAIAGHLAANSSRNGTPATTTEAPSDDAAEGTAEPRQPSTTSAAAAGAAPLSFSAFKARMAKKRDELKAERDIAGVTEVHTAAPSAATSAHGTARGGSLTAERESQQQQQQQQQQQDGRTTSVGTDPTESRNLSTRPSANPTPSLRPSVAPVSGNVPDITEEAADSALPPSRGLLTEFQPQQPASQPPEQQQAPPVKVEKKEVFVLSAMPDPEEEVDLYADLTLYRGRGRGRGRGIRGRGGFRGGFHPHYQPPHMYGQPAPPPQAYRGGYAPAPQYYRPY